MADQTGVAAIAYSGMVASPPVFGAFGVIGLYRAIGVGRPSAASPPAYDTTCERRRPKAEKGSRPNCTYGTSARNSRRFCLFGRSTQENAVDFSPVIGVRRCTNKTCRLKCTRRAGRVSRETATYPPADPAPHSVAAAGGIVVVSRAVNGPDALTPACGPIIVLGAQT
jgi:hypothetical protein